MTDFALLHASLSRLYSDFMPLCSSVSSVARGVAGLGALFFISRRIWMCLSTGREIDVYPLLRPFALGLCIAFFPTLVLGSLNGVMGAVSSSTSRIALRQTEEADIWRQKRDEAEREALLRNPKKAYLVDDAAFDEQLESFGVLDFPDACGMYIDRALYNVRCSARAAFQEFLSLMFRSAELVIDMLRTFFLAVLSILGPIAFAFAVWDPFSSSLSGWLTRYVSVSLWLPVANLFSALLARVEVLMMQADIAEFASASAADGAGTGRVIFMIMGIVGYFTVPTVASWIVHSSGVGAYQSNVNDLSVSSASMALSGADRLGGAIAKKL